MHEGQKGHTRQPNFDFADGSDDADTASVATNATEDTDDFLHSQPRE